MTMRTAMLPLIGLLLALAPSAQAIPSDHPKALLTMLRAIDTMPTAAAIRNTTRSPEDALLKIANDEVLGQYVRRRATSLLSLFPGEKAAKHLKVLTTARSERVAWVATYTFIRMHGKYAGVRARRFAKHVLKSGVPGQREAVIRGLRHVPGEATEAMVEAHAKGERSKRVKAAIRRFRQYRAR